ncbi:MAG TPA: PQQ-binding-like beta-propeller repeat protein [Verrucomicrobiae bacterium]|jgi:hypothetical protein
MNPSKVFPGLLTVFLAATLFVSESEASDRSWRVFYGAGGAGFLEKLAQDDEGNVYVGGSITQNSGSRVSIVKYDSSGHRLWNFIYDSEADTDQFENFAVTGDGKIYVLANRFTTNWSTVVFKLDSDATLLWEKRHEGSAYVLAVDSMRNVFIAGGIDPEGGLRDTLLVKYRGDGEKQWERQFDDPEPPISAAADVAVDSAGNVFVAGFKFTISKFDPEGSLLWQKGYAGQTARKVLVDDDGNAYVTGQLFDAGALTVKLKPNGEEVWQHTYDQGGPGRSPTDPCDLALGPQGSVYVATREKEKHEIFKLAADGTLLWNRKESGKADAPFSSVAVDSEGLAWLFFTKPVSKKKDNVFISGYNTDGKLIARAHLTSGNNGHAAASDILLDPEGNPVVTFRGRQDDVPGWFTTKLPRPGRD